MQHGPNGLRECPHCGEQIKRTSHICPHCRESLAALDQKEWERATPIPHSEQAPSSETSPGLGKVALRPLFVFVAIALVFAFTLFFYAGSADKPVEDSAPPTAPTSISHDRQVAPKRYELTGITEPNALSSPTERAPADAKEQVDAGKQLAEQAEARKQKIKSLSDDIYSKLKEEEVATTDTIHLKSGRVLQCTVIDDLGAQLKVRYKGVTTTIAKTDIEKRTHLSQQAVDMKMRRISLEQAIATVDNELVFYGGEWITPEERDVRKRKAHAELQKAKRLEKAEAGKPRPTGEVPAVAAPPTIGGKSQYSSVTVIEGYGFDGVVVGHPRCTRRFLVSKLGEPDTADKWNLNYEWKYGFRLGMAEDSDLLIEIKLNRRFSGKLRSGITMSSSLDDIFAAYGQPKEEIETDDLDQMYLNYANRTLYRNGRNAKLWYRDLGLYFYIEEDMVKSISILRI